MNERRVATVKRLFDSFEADPVPASLIASRFLPDRHPFIRLGLTTAAAVQSDFETNFLSKADVFPWEAFVEFFAGVSAKVDVDRKECDKDGVFELIVERTWGLQIEHPNTPENVYLNSLEAPRGVAATQNWDFMWKDPASQKLIGYRAVVRPVIARRTLPEWLRYHVLAPEETKSVPYQYLPAQTALLAPFDLLWYEEGLDGEEILTGFRGVINSNVELHLVPFKLRKSLVPSLKAENLGVQYLQAEANTPHPMYQRSNATYGVDIDKVSNTRRAEGGHVWAGRQGQFTSAFTTGPFRSSGLNTSVVKSRRI